MCIYLYYKSAARIIHSQRLNLRHELTGCPNGMSPCPNFHCKQGRMQF